MFLRHAEVDKLTIGHTIIYAIAWKPAFGRFPFSGMSGSGDLASIFHNKKVTHVHDMIELSIIY